MHQKKQVVFCFFLKRAKTYNTNVLFPKTVPGHKVKMLTWLKLLRRLAGVDCTGNRDLHVQCTQCKKSTKYGTNWTSRCQSKLSRGTNVTVQLEGRRVILIHSEVSHELLITSLTSAFDSVLRHTFWTTMTISCFRFRDFPVQLATFFVESLQDLPHFVVPPDATQLQVLPVQLQSGARILNAVVGFSLDVEF